MKYFNSRRNNTQKRVSCGRKINNDPDKLKAYHRLWSLEQTAETDRYPEIDT
jgi:hypothetical protein